MIFGGSTSSSFNAGVIIWTWNPSLVISNYYNFGASKGVHFDYNSLLLDTFGYQTATDYWVWYISSTYAPLSHRWFTGYTIIAITEYIYIYALATTAIIKFDISLLSYITYSYSSTVNYNVPMMYLNYPGTVTGVNYSTGDKAVIVYESAYITMGLPWSSDYSFTANTANVSTTSVAIPSASVIPSLTSIASIDGGNTISFTNYPLTVATETSCTSAIELISIATKTFSLSYFNNVGATPISSIYCAEGSSTTSTMTLPTKPSWLSYTDTTQYFSGTVPTGTTSATATSSITITTSNIVIAPSISITITGTWADSNWIQWSSGSVWDQCNTGYKVNSTNTNQWICQSIPDPVASTPTTTSPSSSSTSSTTASTTSSSSESNTKTFAQLTQDNNSESTGQATAGVLVGALTGVSISSNFLSTQSSTQIIFSLLGFYRKKVI